MVPLDYTDFAIDSRLVLPGGLFFALPGVRVHGEAYLEQTAARGARGAVVSDTYTGPDYGLQLIRVPDVLQALQKTAQRVCPQPVIGVTGTVGKTTTKEFLATILRERFSVHASPKSYNTKRTLPLTILQAKAPDVMVLEMAMDEPGEIRRLCEIAPPKIALIVSIEKNHPMPLETIARAKGEILEQAEVGIIAEDIFHLVKDIGTCRKRIFSADDAPNLPIPGRHNRHNFAAAMVAAEEMGMTQEEIFQAIPKLQLPPQRMQIQETNGITIIDDAYNAPCVASMIAALDSLPQVSGKKIAVFSEMVHLDREAHEAVSRHAEKTVDRLLCVGEKAKWMGGEWFADKKSLAKAIKAEPGDLVLFKGARVHALEEVIDDFLSV